MLGSTIKFAALAMVWIMLVQIVAGQANQPKASSSSAPEMNANVSKFSGWPVEALLNERDALNSQITELNNQIGWMDEVAVKRNDRAQLAAKHKPTEELDDQISGLLVNAGIPGAPLSELDARRNQHKTLLAEK